MKIFQTAVKFKKRILIIASLVVILIAACVVSSVPVFANGNNPVFNLGQKMKAINNTNNKTAVAVINNDKVITKKEFDSDKVFLNSRPDKKVDDDQVLEEIIEQELWYDEAVKNKFTVSDDTVDEYISTAKTLFSKDTDFQSYFTNYISGMGLSEEQYWEKATPCYKKLLTIGNYKSSLRTEFEQNNKISDAEELKTKFDSYCDDLTKQFKSKAKIEYFRNNMDSADDNTYSN